MFIFAIRNPRLLGKLQRLWVLNKFFTLRIEDLDFADNRGLVDHLYKSFYLDNGTSKETRAGRFADIDEKTLGFLKRDSQNLIHDVAVSSGITSIDLYDRLLSGGWAFKLHVSDKFARFYCRGNAVRRIYDSNHVLTRAYIFSLLADSNLHWKYFISRYSSRLIRLLPDSGKSERQIVLYDPRLRNLIEQGLVLEIDYDVFSSALELQFDLVRCMNLLNRSYFSASQISRAIDHLKNSVKEGGILQIGRTGPEGTNDVTFFRRVKNHLTWVEDVNEGSEIKGLVI